MEEKTLAFNEGQLKRAGFADAFTPDLKSKMEQGEPIIQHHFKKDYEGDRVDATLHLKKSPTTDYYFLNKFELELQKSGQDSSTKQTFYISPRAKNEEAGQKPIRHYYTLKEGYNLLAGRPVFKDMVNKGGEEYQAWNKLNFQNILANGNHEIKQYNNNYGFTLDDTLKKYPIKELENDQYRQSLVDSLHRGNLQKATFVDKEGKEEKLYISPSITTGSLNVYDLNKQRVSLENQVEKQLINNEFASHLKERIAQKEVPVQSHKPETKQIPSSRQKQKSSQKPVKDKLDDKSTRKQKIR